MMIEETVELFQTKYRARNGYDTDNEDIDNFVPTVPCILPSGWHSRVSGPGSVYQYSKAEVMEYNEMVYLHGEAVAKRWADRRWHDRTKRNA